MRVALIHDWLTGLRGGEKVLEALCELFPGATIHTLLHVPGTAGPVIESHPIRTAFTQGLPGVQKYYRWYLPLYPWAIASLDLEGYDLVLSSSHCVAKGAIAPPGSLHVCYCHTPMRYVWDRFGDYFGNGLKAHVLFGPPARLLRAWDVRSAARVNHFIANSHYVAHRIETYYQRKADAVIHPPVDTETFIPSEDDPADYFLIVSALVPYKRIDLAVEAFNRRSDRLLIVGTGPDEDRLKSKAAKNIHFLGHKAPGELRALYQGARAALLPGVEDFGIAPVEAQACGRPVVAFGEGGATESVRDGRTGILFNEPTPEALSSAVDKISTLRFNKSELRRWALEFSRERFKARFKAFIDSKLRAP